MKRFILAVLLSAGVIAGYGSAACSVSHAVAAHSPCHQQAPATPPPATSAAPAPRL